MIIADQFYFGMSYFLVNVDLVEPFQWLKGTLFHSVFMNRSNFYLLCGDGFIYTSSLVAKQDRFFKVHVNHSTWIHYLYYCDRINEQRRVRT